MYYFIGIKGTGMASLACILYDLGYEVCGSDQPKHFFTEDELVKRGIRIYDFDPANIKEEYTVIIGNAFLEDFPEVIAARKLCKCYRYHEFLGELMKDYVGVSICGSHGKTTTTTIAKTVLSRFEKTGYLIGDGEGFMEKDSHYLTVESCEFRRHFLAYHPQYAIITNIEIDHVDYFKDEIDYFISYYGHLKPAAFLSYDRQAFRRRAKDSADADFRVTFDENILFRDHDLSLTSEPYGERILEDGKVLMELKCSGGIPLWMVKTLSEEHIYKTSFSKYGTAYMNFIYPEERHKVAASEAGRVAAASGRTAAAASNPQHTAKGRFAAAAAQRKKLPRAAGAFRSQVYTYR